MSPVSTKNAAFKHSARVAWRKVADEAVILDVDTAAYYSLSGPGLLIWELLGEKKSLDQIVAAVADEYEAEDDVIRKDCEELVAVLRKKKIIVPA